MEGVIQEDIEVRSVRKEVSSDLKAIQMLDTYVVHDHQKHVRAGLLGYSVDGRGERHEQQ
jgi:hypothetical protein